MKTKQKLPRATAYRRRLSPVVFCIETVEAHGKGKPSEYAAAAPIERFAVGRACTKDVSVTSRHERQPRVTIGRQPIPQTAL